MKGRSAKTLHWGIVVSWVVIGGWFIAVEIMDNGLGYREFSMPELLQVRSINGLLGDPFLTGISVVAIFGTATSLYVVFRVIAERGPSLAAAILGMLGLGVFGSAALRISFDVIAFSSLIAPFVFVLFSWMIHRNLRSRTDSLPALGCSHWQL